MVFVQLSPVYDLIKVQLVVHEANSSLTNATLVFVSIAVCFWSLLINCVHCKNPEQKYVQLSIPKFLTFRICMSSTVNLKTLSHKMQIDLQILLCLCFGATFFVMYTENFTIKRVSFHSTFCVMLMFIFSSFLQF